jgi:hypothetical protein
MPAYDETEIADLLRLLQPAPERWVAEAKGLPRTRDELDRVLPTLGQEDPEQVSERSREDFDHDDRLVGSASGGRGNDDVEGHMHESEKHPSGKHPSGHDEDFDDDVEGHSHRSGKHPSGHSEEKHPSGLDEDFDDDVEGHMHRT